MEQHFISSEDGITFIQLSFKTPVGSFPGVVEPHAGGYAIFIYGLPTQDVFRTVWESCSDAGAGWSRITPSGRVRSTKEAIHRVEECLRSAIELQDEFLQNHTRDVVDEIGAQADLIAARALVTELKNRLSCYPYLQEAAAKLFSKIDRAIDHRRYMVALKMDNDHAQEVAASISSN